MITLRKYCTEYIITDLYTPTSSLFLYSSSWLRNALCLYGNYISCTTMWSHWPSNVSRKIPYNIFIYVHYIKMWNITACWPPQQGVLQSWHITVYIMSASVSSSHCKLQMKRTLQGGTLHIAQSICERYITFYICIDISEISQSVHFFVYILVILCSN